MPPVDGPRVGNAVVPTAVAGLDESAPTPGQQPPIDLLLSYAFHESSDHRNLAARLPAGSLIWIDSGAYTAYTKGYRIDLGEYAEHLQANRGGWDYAFTLDVIGDEAATRRNTEALWERGLPVLPVFHYGSPLSEWRSLCREYGYVAAGGLVPLAKNRPKVSKYLRHLTRIAEEHGTAVHALGIGGRSTVLATRVWSADSSTVSSAPLYGNVPVYDRTRRRLVMLQAKDADGLWRHRESLRHYGFPLARVMREGRWDKEDRPAMFRASLFGIADMWAAARARNPVRPPERLWAPDRHTHTGTGPKADTAAHSAPDGPRGAHAVGFADPGRLDYALNGPRAAYAVGPGNETNLNDAINRKK